VINNEQFLGVKGKLKKIFLNVVFRLTNKIQSVSHEAHDNLVQHFPYLHKKNKCIVIPNGIEIERFLYATPRNLKSEINLSDEVFLIGFLGRFMAQKGFRYLVDAIDFLRHNQLPKKPIVMTFGNGCFYSHEREMIKKRGLEDFFHFMPFTPNVASAMKGLDVIAMPSLWEACPLQPMEALVCGTPFIGTDCVGLNEVLQGTPASIVPKADSRALANAILLEIQKNRKNVFSSFQHKAARRFNVSKTRNLIFQQYDALTSK
jgi:glycosyltransferase involved in cell wall biosynthesis